MHFPCEERRVTSRDEKSLPFSLEGARISVALGLQFGQSSRFDRNVTATCIQGEYDLVNFTRMKGFSRPPSLGIIPDARNIYIYTYIFRWNLDIRFLIILSKFDPFRFLYALSSVDCVARIGSMQAFENYDFNRVRTSPPSSFPQWHFSRLEFQLRRGITDERRGGGGGMVGDRNKTPELPFSKFPSLEGGGIRRP